MWTYVKILCFFFGYGLSLSSAYLWLGPHVVLFFSGIVLMLVVASMHIIDQLQE